MLYTIGEFSRITQLSVKTLRFYHEKGLLVPVRIDRESGYRFYDSDQIAIARRISFLKKLDLPLARIAEILKSCDDDGDLIESLESHRDLINEQIRSRRETVRTINEIIKKEKEAMKVTDENIEKKELPEMLIAGHRMTGKYSDIGNGFKKLGPAAGRHIGGPAFGLHYCDEYRETDAEFEACFPVKKEVSGEGIDCRKLPGGTALTLIHRGSYETIGQAYEKLINEIKEQGLQKKLPSREVYIKGPGMIFKGNPKNYITEIQILVE